MPIDDAIYLAWLAWLALGNLPTRIASELDLWDVLMQQAPDVAAQIPAAADRQKDSAVADLDNSNALGAVFRVLLNHENRTRALEGRPAVTLAQFKTAIKVLLNGA